MRTRSGRFLLLAVLLIAGTAAALFTAYLVRDIDDLGRAGQAISVRVDVLLGTVQKIEEAQQTYVVPGATDRPTAEHVPMLIEAVLGEVAEIEPQVHALIAGESLKRVADSARALEQLETRAQEHVRLGQELMAADVISSEARDVMNAMKTSLRDFRSAEADAIEVARWAALRQAGMAVGGAAGLWLLGLLILVRIPRAREEKSAATSPSSILSLPEPQRATPTPAGPVVDLDRTANVCTAIARLTDSGDLPSVLTEAAAVLGASGIVVWMAAGDELIAASAHGYDAKAMTRLGPIQRASLNATAAAWRVGAMQIVPGGSQSRGALAVPMWGTDRCVGVLAVEVSNDRERDGPTQAVTRLLAAQLAATLAPWPAASVADSHVSTLDNVAEA